MFGSPLYSLKTKLVLTLTFLIIIFSIFLAIYLPRKFEYERFNALEDKANTICSIASTSVISSVFFNDPDALQQDIYPIIHNKEIAYAVIMDSDSSILYSYNIKQGALKKTITPEKNRDIHNYPVIKVAKDIKINNKTIGKIYLGFTSDTIKTELKALKKDILAVILFILVSGVLLTLSIAYYFTRPLKSVILATREVANGNFDVQAKVYGKDEAGLFAHQFNEMVFKLKSFYTKLDSMVQERTEQLQEINEKLQNEIIERMNAEAKLKASLEEKNVMLKEIHHRVKNNMQVISSLFYLQSRKVKDKEVSQLFTESQNRILSMSLVHENLYQNNDLGKVEFNKYIQKLLNSLKSSFKDESAGINITTDIDPNIMFTVDTAIPLGMIINELITNVFKHAFKTSDTSPAKDKNLLIRLKKDKVTRLEISDNGTGIDPNILSKKTGSLGMELIKGLSRQIDAKLFIVNEEGTKFIIELL